MSTPTRFVAAGDNHGDMADPEALDALDWKVWLVHKVGRQWIWQTDLKLYTPKNK